MLRRLLTCLALITGLAATGTPLSAAAFEQADRSIASSHCARSEGASYHVRIVQPASITDDADRLVHWQSVETIAYLAPTVRFGPDRAHE